MKTAVTTLVFCVAALTALGMVMLYSSGMSRFGSQLFVRQLVWCCIGIMGAVIAASLNYQLLRKVGWPMYGLALLTLILVLIPGVGIYAKGARRWLGFGAAQFQCSEFAKIAVIIALALYADRHQRHMRTFKRGIFYPGLMVLPVLGLIFVEPDRGATILLGVVVFVILIVAGVRWSYFVPPVLAGAVGIVYSLLNDPVRMRRIMSWLNPEENKLGGGWQAYQGLIALGAGGWTGLGLGNGRQKFGFVPEHHNDFIFTMIGEELGLIATLLVVVAYIAIMLCGIYIALRAPDTFGLLIATGITFLIGFQAFINIGVVTGTLPNKGLPLPFISYGGSNLLLMLTSIGLLLSVARHAKPEEKIVRERQAGSSFMDANPFKRGRSGQAATVTGNG